jgi:SAM-dependent methyltransferase
MNTITLHAPGNIIGMTPEQLEGMHIGFAQYDIVRRVERWSIREFMRENKDRLRGTVLDFGAGEEPYRKLVSGKYLTYDKKHSYHGPHLLEPLLGVVDCVMCNQVVQYLTDVPHTLHLFADLLRPLGALVMTFPTNWDEVDETDLHRFTASGMRRMLIEAGFSVVKMECRAQVQVGSFKFPLGYGVVAVKA